ncbi:hypothetical protein K502DRAFT_329223 [Neoconidiobolus thromboides FSU 785]|nr:hypothetical protein K502DRAFT_329223 [Neoconidiobolus thromboides FSU 785]
MNFTQLGKKIIAIGFNYSKHCSELGGNAKAKAPLFFLKPTSSYLLEPNSIELPLGCTVDYEIELGVVIGKEAKDINDETKAMDCISGYTLTIDVTARDLQNEAREKGLPWSISKGFDTFTPVGPFIKKEKVDDINALEFWIKVNSELKQYGYTKDMIFNVPKLICYISKFMKLQEGDLILTGTPEGVGPIRNGDVITAALKEKDMVLSEIRFDVINRINGFNYKL